MPLSQFKCSICGALCPKKCLAHSKSKERLIWLWSHRKRKHPVAHKRSVAKSLKARGH